MAIKLLVAHRMGAAPQICPGATPVLLVLFVSPPVSATLSLHPSLASLSPSPAPPPLSFCLPISVCVSVSLAASVWDPESRCGAPVPRKGLCPRLRPHPCGSLTRDVRAAVGRERPHPFPLSPFCLCLGPPQALLSHCNRERFRVKAWAQIPLPPLTPCGTSDKSFVLRLSLVSW